MGGHSMEALIVRATYNRTDIIHGLNAGSMQRIKMCPLPLQSQQTVSPRQRTWHERRHRSQTPVVITSVVVSLAVVEIIVGIVVLSFVLVVIHLFLVDFFAFVSLLLLYSAKVGAFERYNQVWGE
jgi:hypothetical protein